MKDKHKVKYTKARTQHFRTDAGLTLAKYNRAAAKLALSSLAFRATHRTLHSSFLTTTPARPWC